MKRDALREAQPSSRSEFPTASVRSSTDLSASTPPRPERSEGSHPVHNRRPRPVVLPASVEYINGAIKDGLPRQLVNRPWGGKTTMAGAVSDQSQTPKIRHLYQNYLMDSSR